jgi:uncharacterized protein (DUF2126 family)
MQRNATDPAGYILPIRRRQPEWPAVLVEPVVVSSPRTSVAIAGRFAIGYRIPTESMPWVAPDELKYEYDAAPLAAQA